MIINAASSCWSGLKIEDSIDNIVNKKTIEPLFGIIASDHIQICPQHSNYFDENIAEEIIKKYPSTQFRLHADVRLKNKRGITIDLSDYSEENKWYFEELAHLSNKLNSKVYSLHSGKRHSELDFFKQQYLKVQEIFGDIKVCIEGMYPTSIRKWFIDSWEEYSWLAENEIPYALDLSHLHILEKKLGANDNLIKELINNPLCEEVHLSFNDGNLDSHEIAQDKFNEKHLKYLEFLNYKLDNSVIFTEGNQVLHQKKMAKEVSCY